VELKEDEVVQRTRSSPWNGQDAGHCILMRNMDEMAQDMELMGQRSPPQRGADREVEQLRRQVHRRAEHSRSYSAHSGIDELMHDKVVKSPW